MQLVAERPILGHLVATVWGRGAGGRLHVAVVGRVGRWGGVGERVTSWSFSFIRMFSGRGGDAGDAALLQLMQFDADMSCPRLYGLRVDITTAHGPADA